MAGIKTEISGYEEYNKIIGNNLTHRLKHVAMQHSVSWIRHIVKEENNY